MATDERHECICGRRATRWIMVTLINLVETPLWLCDDCHAKEMAEVREYNAMEAEADAR